MQFNLKSKITNHAIDLSSLAERVIVGPQEEVLRTIESFNHTFNSNIRCTKRFRWEPGFYKKLNALQIKAMSLDKFPRTVQSAFNKVANGDWYHRRLRDQAKKIDTMLYQLRSNNMMFQDNTEAVTEQTAAWFNSIMSTADVMNETDNGYLFEIYHAMDSEYDKDYIVFVITVDGYNMDIGTSDIYAPIECGKVKMYVALDLIKVIGGAISGSDLSFGREYQHSGYHLGGQYFPTNCSLHFPYISGGRGWSSRVLNFMGTISDYTVMDDGIRDNDPGTDGYTALCFGDVKDQILKPLASGRLDEAVFWLNKWGSFYHISRTSPLNNYTKMYHGTPEVLYGGNMIGLLSSKNSQHCDYTVPIDQSESYCDIYECTLRDGCSKYETAYATVDDNMLAMREQILANYMFNNGMRIDILEDEERFIELTEHSLNTMEASWSTAERHWIDMRDHIQSYFGINVVKDTMLYVMASACREVDFGNAMSNMEGYDMGIDGFEGWLDNYFPERTIDVEILEGNEASDHDGESATLEDRLTMENQLLEHYSSTGRGIPIQIRERV